MKSVTYTHFDLYNLEAYHFADDLPCFERRLQLLKQQLDTIVWAGNTTDPRILVIQKAIDYYSALITDITSSIRKKEANATQIPTT